MYTVYGHDSQNRTNELIGTTDDKATALAIADETSHSHATIFRDGTKMYSTDHCFEWWYLKNA